MSITVLEQSPLIGVSMQGKPGVNGSNGTNGANGIDGVNGFGASYRPGDRPEAFTGVLAGASPAPLSADGVVADQILGNVYDLAAIGYVALREALWLEPQAFYAIRMIFERSRDPVLYESTTVVAGVQWLDATYEPLAQGIAQVFPSMLVADGLQVLTARVPPAAGDGIPLNPPPGAVFWRPFLQDASVNGVLRVLGMTVSDVTNAGVYAPDIARMNQRLTALESIIRNKAVQA